MHFFPDSFLANHSGQEQSKNQGIPLIFRERERNSSALSITMDRGVRKVYICLIRKPQKNNRVKPEILSFTRLDCDTGCFIAQPAQPPPG
jgi:hypothetical protein